VQKNSAVEKGFCDWVLCLNTDETVSEGLAKEIEAVLQDPTAPDGHIIPRKNMFLSRVMRFGGLSRRPS
jgi:uncharacterized protein (DUF2267 family)